VPELHKDGAIHFHGLLSQIGDINAFKTNKKDKQGKDIYNFKDFNLGFTTATKVKDTKAVSTYISKYISLELVIIGKNKHKYWCSKDLERPKETLEYIQEKKITKLNDNLKQLCDFYNEYSLNIEGVEHQQTTHFYFNSNTD
jgi:predicted nucleotidyltransferase